MILTHGLGWWWCVYDGYMFELGLTASGRQRIDRAELDGIVKHDEPATIALPFPINCEYPCHGLAV
jgi:hypothetical protein